PLCIAHKHRSTQTSCSSAMASRLVLSICALAVPVALADHHLEGFAPHTDLQGVPQPGYNLSKQLTEVSPLNEPCYVHDSACEGYPVCCVTAGTCVSEHGGIVSSNRAYYEGGCQSHESSNTEWDDEATGCVAQGECHWLYLQFVKGATTKEGEMTAVPMEVDARLVVGSEPVAGNNITLHNDGWAPLNEPCYVHDSACQGYPVCCVTYGTCASQHGGTLSSNRKYYEGGCQSLQSSKTEWTEDAAGCSEQGECHWVYLQEWKNATTKAGMMADVPSSVTARFMTYQPTTTTTTMTTTEAASLGARSSLSVGWMLLALVCSWLP
ncbi:putative tandem protein 6, partial [Amphidinium carterae]